MMLLKVSSASGSTVIDETRAGRVHPLFIADPAVRHTFVLGKILIGGLWESAETQHSVVVS
jgi:hypothetical protein